MGVKVFRRGVLMCTVGVLAIAFVFSCGAKAVESKNIVVNGDFRDGAKGWSVPRKGWKVVAGDGMNSGEGALVWENSDPNFYEFPVQHFKPIPGVAYRFRALARVDSLDGNRFEAGLEWSSTAGKWLGGAYGRAVYDNDVSVKDGWVKYEILTPPMPADVGRCGVFCAVKKGATGRVRFCGFTVETDIQEPLSFFVSSLFRDEAASGRVGFFAGLHVDVIDRPFKDYAAEIRFTDAKGRESVRKPEIFTVDRAVFNLKAEDLAIGAQDVRFRLLAKGKEVATATRRFTRLEKPVARHIAFDSARRLLIDANRSSCSACTVRPTIRRGSTSISRRRSTSRRFTPCPTASGLIRMPRGASMSRPRSGR